MYGEFLWFYFYDLLVFLLVQGSIMHAVLLGPVIIIVSLCSARPAQHDTFQTIPLDSTAPPLGIVARHLATVDAYVATTYETPLCSGF